MDGAGVSGSRTGMAFAAGLAGGLAAGRLADRERLQFMRLAGSSIAAPSAAGWITDFLNAAYYRRPLDQRTVEDLRLANAIITTYWLRGERRRLRGSDVVAFHRAFGRERFLEATQSPRGTLSGAQLLAGARRLFGDWFPDAYADPARRGWGAVFTDARERAAYRPERRLEMATLGPLTPEMAPVEQQTWHTYPPVELPSSERALAALAATETWPDYATEIGRFTPLRSGGLLGQIFEIEVAAGTEAGAPIFQRGYVTITQLVTPEDPEALSAYFLALQEGLARYGRDEPPALPEGGVPVAGFDLTTHEGHFMGAGHNRLIVYEHEGRSWVRAAGTWDPLPWHLEQVYRVAGREAQHAFWGEYGQTEKSMLHQLALAVA